MTQLIIIPRYLKILAIPSFRRLLGKNGIPMVFSVMKMVSLYIDVSHIYDVMGNSLVID